jgi:ATP synthase F1 complex assembly factor 1
MKQEIWTKHHAEQKDTTSIAFNGEEGRDFLRRAKSCPFFIQPIFREEGFFNLLCQFQSPSFFLLAYLDDYKTSPEKANPLVTFSVFDDLATSHDLTLVRGEVVDRSVTFEEGEKIIKAMIHAYKDDNEFQHVEAFNKTPEKFDFEAYISLQRKNWKK